MNKSLLERVKEKVRHTPLPPLQKGAVIGLAVLIGFTVSSSNVAQRFEDGFVSMLGAVLPSVVVTLTNLERSDENLTTLRRSDMLDKAARLKAEHMRDNDYFAHFSPEGVSPWYWFDTVDYNYLHAGENLAVFFDDSGEVVQAWMDSPLHRDNILKDEYTEIGVATVEAQYEGYNTVFVVQLFGTPLSKTEPAATPEITPKQVQTPTLATQQNTTAGSLEVRSATDLRAVEKKPDTIPATSTKTTVRLLPIDDQTVFISNHASTTIHTPTIPASIKQNTAPSPSSSDSERMLQTLYMLTTLLISGTLVVSIAHASKNLQYVQAVYGISLLLATVATVSTHVYIVKALTIF